MGGETANLSKTPANLCQIVPLSAPPLFLVRKRARAAERPLTDSFLIPLLPRRLFGLVFFRQGHGDGERREGGKGNSLILSRTRFPSRSPSLGSGRGGSGSSKKFKIAAGG